MGFSRKEPSWESATSYSPKGEGDSHAVGTSAFADTVRFIGMCVGSLGPKEQSLEPMFSLIHIHRYPDSFGWAHDPRFGPACQAGICWAVRPMRVERQL